MSSARFLLLASLLSSLARSLLHLHAPLLLPASWRRPAPHMDVGEPPVSFFRVVGARPLHTADSARHGLSLSILKSIGETTRDEWDACATGGDPFVLWSFLHALESSRSVHPEEGWMPQQTIGLCVYGSRSAMTFLF